MAEIPIETIQAAIDAGQEITAEQSSTRVVLYRASVIIVNRTYTMVLCADCGQVKSAFMTDGAGELSQVQVNRLAYYFSQLPRCQCAHGGD